MSRTTHKVISISSDKSVLGWWVWTCYWGKHNLTQRVITTYRPCITSSIGVKTTQCQHQRYLDRTKDNRSPRQSILEYLFTAISKWRKLGDQIFLMIDLNEKITPDTVTEIFTKCRPHGGYYSPPSWYRSGTNVPKSITPNHGIYTLSTLQVSSGG